MGQQSTSCWIRRCNRQYIFLPQFTLVSRCRARDEKFLFFLLFFSLSNSFASFICDRRELSLFTASAAAGPEPRGADDRPNSLEKTGQPRAELFSHRKKAHNERTPFPREQSRACSSPKHITHRSCVSSSVRQRWHGSTHLLKRFSTDIFLLTLQKQGPLKEKREWCVPQVPLYARRRSLACVIGVHLPMPSALGVFNHASGNRSRWRRSQSEPRKRTQCRVPFGREPSFCYGHPSPLTWTL